MCYGPRPALAPALLAHTAPTLRAAGKAVRTPPPTSVKVRLEQRAALGIVFLPLKRANFSLSLPLPQAAAAAVPLSADAVPPPHVKRHVAVFVGECCCLCGCVWVNREITQNNSKPNPPPSFHPQNRPHSPTSPA